LSSESSKISSLNRKFGVQNQKLKYGRYSCALKANVTSVFIGNAAGMVYCLFSSVTELNGIMDMTLSLSSNVYFI